MKLIDLVKKIVPTRVSKMDGKQDLNLNQKNSIYINESGMYQLIMKSKMKEAESFQDWVTDIVLPSIRKNGKYEIKHEEDKNAASMIEHKLICETTTLSEYDKVNVFYIGYVGLYDNIKIYKYGVTANIYRRIEEHKDDYNTFELLYITKVNNLTETENIFKSEMKSRQLNIELELNGKNRKELCRTSPKYDIDSIIEISKDLKRNNLHHIVDLKDNQISELLNRIKDKEHEDQINQIKIEKLNNQIENIKNEYKMKLCEFENKILKVIIEIRNNSSDSNINNIFENIRKIMQ